MRNLLLPRKEAMKPMKELSNETALSPLSTDVELRRPGAEPASLDRSLMPLVTRFIRDLTEAADRLKELASEARAVKDYRAETVILARVADIAASVLRIARLGKNSESQIPPMTLEDDLDWSRLSPELAEKLAPLLEQAAKELRQQ